MMKIFIMHKSRLNLVLTPTRLKLFILLIDSDEAIVQDESIWLNSNWFFSQIFLHFEIILWLVI